MQRTQTALRNRIVFIAFNLDELSALIGVKLQRTAYRMAARGGPRACTRDRQSVLLVAPRLIEVVFILADREFATRV